MSQTVIGIFENSTRAQEAKSYLLANGFNSENVDVNNSGTSGYTSAANDGKEDGVGERISDFFKNLFSDHDEAASHIAAAQKGTTVTVHAQTSETAMKAAETLNNYGAVDVNEYSGKFSGDNNSTDSIKVIKEELQVGKQEVETGGVRLRSRIVERPVEERIRLREEHVNVERHAVDRPATEADFADFQEGTVELREHAERPVVAKTARVVEEVSLGKEVAEKDEVISDTVRHTEVETDNITGMGKDRKDGL